MPTPADVVAFWRAAGPKRWFEKDAAFDDEIRARFLRAHEAAAAGKLAAWEANARRRAGAAHPARPVPAQHVPRRGARLRHRSAGARDHGRRHRARLRRARCRAELRSFFYLPFEHSENLADQERGIALYKAAGDADGAEMGGAARRHHPPLRPLPAPQRRARPQPPRRRNRSVSRRRRVRGDSVG